MDREEILKILSSYKLSKAEIEYLYLQLYFTEELNNEADEQILELHKEQKENRDSILNEIAKIMLSYPITESIMSIGNSDKLKLQDKLNTLIQNKIQSEVNTETLKTKDVLESTGKNKYDINNYINYIGTNDKLDINPVEDKTLNKIINDKVENKTWTDRLWDNKNDLQKDLKGEIDNFLNGKTTVNEIEEKIKKKYNKNAYETKRLVHTEVARVQEEMNQAWAKEHGVKYQMFMATLDFKTSQVCRGFDTKVFEFNDVNKPIPPLHPFCRSTLVNIPSKDWKPSQRLDNVTKEKVSWQTYEEWYQNNSGKMGGVSKSDKWQSKGTVISKEEYKELRDYAKEKGIALSEFKKFDGDVSLVKETIDDMSMLVNKYPILNDEKKPLTLKLNYYMEDEEFAQAKEHIIDINGKALRDKELLKSDYLNLSKNGWFTANTSYRAIVKHEIGHTIHDLYKIDTISISKKILNIDSNKELFVLLKNNLSTYSSKFFDGSEILAEVFAEFYDSKNPREFSLKFMEEFDKIIKRR